MQDQGVGFPAADFSKLFQPFSRTSARAPSGERGTGLGLWISQRIVESHGGTIRATSTPGRGSIFEVSLPLRAHSSHGERF